MAFDIVTTGVAVGITLIGSAASYKVTARFLEKAIEDLKKDLSSITAQQKSHEDKNSSQVLSFRDELSRFSERINYKIEAEQVRSIVDARMLETMNGEQVRTIVSEAEQRMTANDQMIMNLVHALQHSERENHDKIMNNAISIAKLQGKKE